MIHTTTGGEDCPNCRSRLKGFRRGSCLVVSCSSPSCSWEVVTTFPVPILRDPNRYVIRIHALPNASSASLIALNKMLTNGIAVTRSLAKGGSIPPFEGNALEVWHEAQRLTNEGIPFCIEPSYLFDLNQPEDAFGPPDGPMPS